MTTITITVTITIIICMKKLLDSDWLRAVQFKCNTSTKSVTLVEKMKHQCKLHIVILDYDWLKDNSKFFKPIISHKMVTKILCGNLEKSFLKWEKMASRKIFWHFLHVNFFMVILLISNHTVLFNLELTCTWEFFKKLKLCLPKQLVQFQLFEKLTHAN